MTMSHETCGDNEAWFHVVTMSHETLCDVVTMSHEPCRDNHHHFPGRRVTTQTKKSSVAH